MKFLLPFILVASIATPIVHAEKRLRGEKNIGAIEHEPEDVRRALKKLSVGRGGAFTDRQSGGINAALDTVKSSLARKGGGMGSGTSGAAKQMGASRTPVTGNNFATKNVVNLVAPTATPAATKGGGMGTSKQRKGGDAPSMSPAAMTFPTNAAPSMTTSKTSKGTKGASTDKGSASKSDKGSSTRRGDSVETNQVNFFHLSPNNAVPVSAADTTFDSVGTVFMFGGPLYDANATVIPNTNFTGVCTKTQQAGVIDNDRTLVGGGYCQFTYMLEIAADGTPSTTMNAVGEVFDLAGGVMTITGGTGGLVGSTGQAKVLPLYANETLLFDFFTRAIVYEVNATVAMMTAR